MATEPLPAGTAEAGAISQAELALGDAVDTALRVRNPSLLLGAHAA